MHEDEDPSHLDPQRFAAVPAVFPKHSKDAFIIDENNTIFRSDRPEHRNVTVFPKELAASGWSKQD